MPMSAERVQLAASGDLEAASARRTPASHRRIRRVDPETPQVLLRHVLATPVEIFGDVAEEVGELERVAQVPGVGRRVRRAVGSRMGNIISPMTAAEPSM